MSMRGIVKRDMIINSSLVTVYILGLQYTVGICITPFPSGQI